MNTSAEAKAFAQRMDGGYSAPILAEPKGGPIPSAPDTRHLPGKHNQADHGRKRGGVRPALAGAKNIGDLNTAAAAEAKRITGRDIGFDMAGSDLEVAKEHVEGVMQGLDRYPNAGLESVGTYGPGASRSGPARFADIVGKEAYALSDSETILFNNRFGGDGASYRQLLAHETGGHIGQLARDPRGVGLHEFGHVMAEGRHGTTDHVAEHVAEHAHATGANSKDFAAAHISRYAASDPHELAAEVFADVMINGANASAVSKSAFDIITGAS